jgi:hypothetical protein
MKIEDFKRYRMIIESEGSIPNEDAAKVEAWLRNTGRLDEGVWSSIWSWLKRHFSPTARKLYALADQYEAEYTAELRAEWTKTKDLASKVRAGSYAKLSRDIEDRMDIIAKDDEDYRMLVKVLINKANLKVKKAMLVEFTGKIDDDDLISSETTKLSREEKEAERKEKEIIDKVSKAKAVKWEPIIDFMRKKIDENRSFYAQIDITTTEEKTEFIKTLCFYVDKLAEKTSSIKFDEKTVYNMSKKYVELVNELYRKLEDRLSKPKAIKKIKSVLKSLMLQEKPIAFERLKSDVLSTIERELKDGESSDSKSDGDTTPDDLSAEVVTPDTEKVAPVPVPDMVDVAKDNTGKTKPSPKQVDEEVIEKVKTYFNNSSDHFQEDLITKVKEFNNSDAKQKEILKDKFDYSVDSKGNLPEPTQADTVALLHDFVKIAGKLIPYYLYNEKNAKFASMAVAEYLFQIYAIKKDVNKRLSDADSDSILKAIIASNKL